MSDPYRVEWTPTAKRDLRRLPEKIATAAVEFVYGALRDNPHRLGHELQLDLAGFHSARRGDFRVIYTIASEPDRIIVAAISHRADAYRPR
ncbi:MAG TPA: type II toxin-antitoxin system RelE/ParE family toxin [Sporichthyaceae bacterium]|jgi:mRNA-degrading endonuclease RelE of RelBE toxin-antitoxin system|nr:type II toxin-antitoxin system RelE/ParE family toxin [Sporichthyaceae bacterium]